MCCNCSVEYPFCVTAVFRCEICIIIKKKTAADFSAAVFHFSFETIALPVLFRGDQPFRCEKRSFCDGQAVNRFRAGTVEFICTFPKRRSGCDDIINKQNRFSPDRVFLWIKNICAVRILKSFSPIFGFRLRADIFLFLQQGFPVGNIDAERDSFSQNVRRIVTPSVPERIGRNTADEIRFRFRETKKSFCHFIGEKEADVFFVAELEGQNGFSHRSFVMIQRKKIGWKFQFFFRQCDFLAFQRFGRGAVRRSRDSIFRKETAGEITEAGETAALSFSLPGILFQKKFQPAVSFIGDIILYHLCYFFLASYKNQLFPRAGNRRVKKISCGQHIGAVK